jgi:hypothetical protein
MRKGGLNHRDTESTEKTTEEIRKVKMMFCSVHSSVLSVSLWFNLFRLTAS